MRPNNNKYEVIRKFGDEIKISFGVIYKLTNLVNGKVYVGKTGKKMEERLCWHYNRSKTKNYPLCLAIRKYGWGNFECEVIDTGINEEELNLKESFYIRKYRSDINFEDSNGYNVTLGEKVV
ncbi:GIY-YIG nuclease family protein [Metabacillus fastidiosus]|uniref:GIY-YIG nuclease family protein n=1 Tax=Metabacillus fastidiosus TaxID=1458 RepID=UPI003D2CCD27